MKDINDKTIIERLVEFMVYKNLNDNKITTIAGLSIGLIGRARKNNSGLHSDTIEKILLAFPELNPTWLLIGNGNMICANDDSSKPENIDNSNTHSSLIDDIFNTQKEVLSLIRKKYYDK